MEGTGEQTSTIGQPPAASDADTYEFLISGITGLLERARRAAARCVNALLTATYWEIGRRIVEHEQGGRSRAGYGEELLAAFKRSDRKLRARIL